MLKLLFTFFLMMGYHIGSSKVLNLMGNFPINSDFQRSSSSQILGINSPNADFQSDSLPGLLVLELADDKLWDSIPVRFWNELISERRTVTPGFLEKFPAMNGNFFQGNRGYQVFSIPFPNSESSGFFSMGTGKNTLVKYWMFFPRDRVRIRVDLRSATLSFGGPDADFYRLQHEINQAFEEEVFNSSPLLFNADTNSLYQDTTTQKLWLESRRNPDDLFVKLKLIQNPLQAWEQFLAFSKQSWVYHPATKILDRYAQSLSEHRMDLVEAAIKGNLFFKGMQKAASAWETIRNDKEKQLLFREWVDSFYLESMKESHPLLAQGVYQWAVMEASLSHQSLPSVLGNLSNPLREQVIAFYILDNHNRMEDRLTEIIEQHLPFIQSNWIKDRFQALIQTRANPFVPGKMELPDGSFLDPQRIQGKALLVHFWINGCRFCKMEYEDVLAQLKEKLGPDQDILILTVNADSKKENWKKGLESGAYADSEFLNVWVPSGTGITKYYGIHSFPQKLIVSPDGNLILQSIDRIDANELTARLKELSNAKHQVPLTSNSKIK